MLLQNKKIKTQNKQILFKNKFSNLENCLQIVHNNNTKIKKQTRELECLIKIENYRKFWFENKQKQRQQQQKNA